MQPAIVVIHGGGWVGGSKSDPDVVFLSLGLAQHGEVAFDISYRLAGHGGSFFGPTDLTAFPTTSPQTAPVVARYLGTTYDENPELYRTASPVSYARQAVPTIMEHGTADTVVPHSQALELHQMLVREGVRTELVSVPGGQRGLGLGHPGAQRDREIARLITFLDGVFSSNMLYSGLQEP